VTDPSRSMTHFMFCLAQNLSSCLSCISSSLFISPSKLFYLVGIFMHQFYLCLMFIDLADLVQTVCSDRYTHHDRANKW